MSKINDYSIEDLSELIKDYYIEYENYFLKVLKDEKIYVHDVDRVAEFLGWGIGFIFEDIVSEFKDFDAQDDKIEAGDCPWCGVSSHLIRLDPPVTLPTLPEAISGFAKPIIWSDGTLSDGASDKVAGLIR